MLSTRPRVSCPSAFNTKAGLKGLMLEIQVQGTSTMNQAQGAAEVEFRIPFGREDTVQMSPDQRVILLQMV